MFTSSTELSSDENLKKKKKINTQGEKNAWLARD
jgi:hypothetical protein